MKNILFLCIGVIGFTSLLFAGEQDVSIKGEILPVMSAAVSGAQETPRWKARLEEIRQTTDVVVETNRKLIEESAALQEEVSSVEREIAAQQDKNRQLELSISGKKAEAESPAQLAQLKEEIRFTDKALQDKKKELGALKGRLKSANDRIALRHLKIQQLGIEKKALEVSDAAGGGAGPSDVAREINDLKSKIDSLKGQEQIVREKMASSGDISAADAGKIRQAAQERDALQDALVRLDKEKEAVSRQLVDIPAVEGGVAPGKDAKRFAALTAQKKAFDLKASELQMQKDTLRVQADPETVSVDELVAAGKKLQQESSALEAGISDVRENISVLEYKINSLERYKDRNRKDL